MASVDRGMKGVSSVKADMKAIDKSTCCHETSSLYRGRSGGPASGSVGDLSGSAKKASKSKTKKPSYG